MSGYTEIEVPETLHIEQTGPDAETPQEEAREREPSPREIAMANIAKRREEQIERELAFGVTMEDEARAAGGGEPIDRTEPPDGLAGAEGSVPSPRTPEPQAAAVPSATVPVAPAEERRTPIVLGGVEYRVTDAELAHLAGIGAQAVQQHHQAQQRQFPAPQEQPRAAEPAPAPAAPIDRERAVALVRRMSYGNDDDGAAAIEELISLARPTAPAVDPRAIVETAKAELRAENQFNQNLSIMAREYADVFGPVDRPMTPAEQEASLLRQQMAALVLHQHRQRDAALGITKSDLDAYREVGNKLRAQLPPLVAPQSGQQTATPNQPASQAARPSIATGGDRLERKRAAPRQPTSVSRAASGETQRPPPTASDIVAQIARARHQQSPIRAG